MKLFLPKTREAKEEVLFGVSFKDGEAEVDDKATELIGMLKDYYGATEAEAKPKKEK